MSYSLRPSSKLKRPARYEDELDISPEPGSSIHDTVMESQSPPDPAAQTVISPARYLPGSSSAPFTVHPATSSAAAQGPPPTPAMRDADSTKYRRKMANVRFIKKKAVANEHQENEREDIPGLSRRRSGGRPSKVTRDAAAATATANDSTATVSQSRSAAFPSLSTNAPPSPPVIIGDFVGNSMKELMEALEESDEEAVTAFQQHVDGLYATGPEWYKELRGRWAKDESNTEVSQAYVQPLSGL
jgi:hypothetical protein